MSNSHGPRKAWFLLSIASFTPLAQTPVRAVIASHDNQPSASTNHQQLLSTDKAIFQELLKLSKFNVHFHLEANLHQKWRNVTYPLGREAGTAMSFAATLIDLRQQVRGLNNTRKISRSDLKKAVACGIIGSAISGGSSALELAQNTWVMMKAREQGYSPARSLAFIKEIVAKTDKLLATREQLVATEASPEHRRGLDLETALVRRIRQQLLFEFGTWSCHSRDLAWRENTFYALDSAQSFTRLGAGILTMKAFNNPPLAHHSVICAVVASSLATLNPIIANGAGVAVRKYQERKLAREIPFERPDMPELDDLLAKLTSEVTAAAQLPPANTAEKTDDWMKHVATLTTRTGRLDQALDRETKEIERFRQIAQQQTISGPLIGLTGVTGATLATVAVYGHRTHPDTAIRLGFSGRITQGAGQAYALLNTPYTFIRGAIKNHRLRKRGELPAQMLAARLKRLDDAEKELGVNHD